MTVGVGVLRNTGKTLWVKRESLGKLRKLAFHRELAFHVRYVGGDFGRVEGGRNIVRQGVD